MSNQWPQGWSINGEKNRANYKDTPKEPGDNRPVVCLTGIPIARRHDVKAIAEEHDFRVVSGLRKTLLCLVDGQECPSGKPQTAKELGIPVITEDEFMDLVEYYASNGSHQDALVAVLEKRKG